MKKVIMIISIASLFLMSCSSTKKTVQTSNTINTVAVNELSGASYSHADSGLKVVFLASDVVDIYTGPNASPLTCSYTYDARQKKGEITMPGNTGKSFDFTLNSNGVLLSLKQVGETTAIPMKKL
ncbi:hypothetical protein [Dysgonomonas reticulitermitis]